MSFYTLKDSSGSTQLVATGRRLSAGTSLEYMSQIPPESSVVVQGEVKLRPLSSQRSVSNS